MTMKLSILIVVGLLNFLVLAVQQCSLETGGGICPDGNTCCPLSGGGGSGCIPNDMGSFYATCCSDGLSGCALNYTCEENGMCHAKEGIMDPLLEVMPRYTLCHPNAETMMNVHGFPIINDTKLAYYSSHGNILRMDGYRIEMALVIIHGAGRNADDYYCSTSAAVSLQKEYLAESVLLIVPRFPSVADDGISLVEGGIPLQWADEGDGPWRYGAQAVLPLSATNISSFDTLDLIMDLLHNKTRFPNIKQITLAGHSSGGQFVQRYTLLTSSWSNTIRMRGVVANPSNYAYLTPYRLINGTWKIPNRNYCSQYNEWEYGLEKGGNMPVPYKDRQIQLLENNITALMKRFATRDMTYLAGSADRCNVSESQRNGWCFSHGLETTCMDMLQGATRWERNVRYVASLHRLGITTHKRRVVSDVGHDHSLIFTSPTGLSALFPPAHEENVADSRTE